MTQTPRPFSTIHLVDPEAAPALDAFTPFSFSIETLPAIREGMGPSAADLPDPAEVYPTITRTDHSVPGAEGDPDVTVLLYEPVGRASSVPGMLWIHGGGYVVGSAADDDLTCRRIATETGAVVASVDYRLAPETPAPGPVDDCYAALAWFHKQVGVLGLDPARIAIGGASAGGGLAACLAILTRDRGEFSVSYQLLVYPMLDDRTGTTVEASPYVGEFIWTPADNLFGWTSLLGHEPGGEKVSPHTAAARVETVAGLPPAYIGVGSLDLFLDEDLEYAKRLVAAGIPTEVHVYPGGYHGFNMAPDARITLAHWRDLIGALNRHYYG